MYQRAMISQRKHNFGGASVQNINNSIFFNIIYPKNKNLSIQFDNI